MLKRPVTVVEVEPFPTRARDVWSEDGRLEFIDFIARHPTAGDLVPGAGGVRKVRWSRTGMGKRGGVRVIYYYCDDAVPVFLLTVYTKGKKDDLTPQERTAIGRQAKELKAHYRRRSL